MAQQSLVLPAVVNRTKAQWLLLSLLADELWCCPKSDAFFRLPSMAIKTEKKVK